MVIANYSTNSALNFEERSTKNGGKKLLLRVFVCLWNVLFGIEFSDIQTRERDEEG